MILNFVKMQAQGNDFVIVDGLDTEIPHLPTEAIQRICDRHIGIGCDQLLLLMPHAEADARMVIYNGDGSQAENCGNGLRCAGELLMRKGGQESVTLALADRIVSVKRVGSSVQVNMGRAVIEQDQPEYTDISFGNPHRVCFQGEDVSPERNVEIVSAFDEQQVTIRIIERGAGETLACGSGACATAVAVWQKLGKVAPLTIHMPGGDVVVSQENEETYLEGKVAFVFQGVYIL